MPEALAKKPYIPAAVQPYMEAYLKLAKRRQIGYASPQPMLYSEIIWYGLTHGFRHDIAFFCRVVTELDDDAMEEEAKKAERKSAASKAKKPSKGPRRGRRR